MIKGYSNLDAVKLKNQRDTRNILNAKIDQVNKSNCNKNPWLIGRLRRLILDSKDKKKALDKIPNVNREKLEKEIIRDIYLEKNYPQLLTPGSTNFGNSSYRKNLDNYTKHTHSKPPAGMQETHRVFPGRKLSSVSRKHEISLNHDEIDITDFQKVNTVKATQNGQNFPENKFVNFDVGRYGNQLDQTLFCPREAGRKGRPNLYLKETDGGSKPAGKRLRNNFSQSWTNNPRYVF